MDNDTGSVENKDIIFGSDVDPILPMTYKSFGGENKSSYIETSLGVIFSGDLKKRQANLYMLPHYSETIACA